VVKGWFGKGQGKGRSSNRNKKEYETVRESRKRIGVVVFKRRGASQKELRFP